MFNPGGSTPVGTGFPLVPFASLPAASTVEGQVRRLTEFPHVSLIALGGIWRPFGGRQVLAQRRTRLTYQNLSLGIIETLGPFPGGLIKSGMGLEADALWSAPAVGTGNRRGQIAIANAPASSGTIYNAINAFDYGVNSLTGGLRYMSQFNAANDTSGPHPTGLIYNISFGADSTFNGIYGLTIDVSQPCYITIVGQSCAETAVNIATATWVGGVATYNTSAVHTLAVGDKTTIAGVDLAGYNGVVVVASVVDTDTFTVAMASDPGGSGTGGTSSRISNMVSQSYVLELVG
jgi:hypothetical protein